MPRTLYSYADLPGWPRGLCRTEAAIYIGISPTTFDKMVDDGRMPKPKRINARRVWDRTEIDLAFAALPVEDGENEGEANEWDAA